MAQTDLKTLLLRVTYNKSAVTTQFLANFAAFSKQLLDRDRCVYELTIETGSEQQALDQYSIPSVRGVSNRTYFCGVFPVPTRHSSAVRLRGQPNLRVWICPCPMSTILP